MSLYRLAVVNGNLIREKRKLLRWWCWSFNRCEEDHLNRMKNRLTALRQEQSGLQAAIPEEEERVMKLKDILRDHGDSNPRRDGWTPRREPVRLKKETNLGKPKKKKDKPAKDSPSPLLHITPAK